MSNRILVYDPSCPFCAGLAKHLGKTYDIEILPNDSRHLPEYVNKEAVRRDVHYFLQYRKSNLAVLTFRGARAAVEILAIRHPFLAGICRLPLIKNLVDILYFIVKKSRKFL